MDDWHRLKLLTRTTSPLRSNVCFFNSELLPDKFFAAFCIPGSTIVVQQVPNGPGDFTTKLLVDLPEKSSNDSSILLCWGGGEQQLLAAGSQQHVYLLSLQSIIPVNEQSSNAHPVPELRAKHALSASLVAMQFTHAGDGLLLSDVLGNVSMLAVDQQHSKHQAHLSTIWQVNSDVRHDLIAAGAHALRPCATASQENNQRVLIWWPAAGSNDSSVGTEAIRHPVRVVALEWSPSLTSNPLANDDVERRRNPALMTLGSDGVIRIWVEVVMKLPDTEPDPALPTLSQYCTALVIKPPTFPQSLPTGVHASWARQVKGSFTNSSAVLHEPCSPNASGASKVLWLVCMLDFTASSEEDSPCQHVFVWALEGLAGIVLNGLPQGVITSSKPIPPRAVLWGSDSTTVKWLNPKPFQTSQILHQALISQAPHLSLTGQTLQQGLTAFCDSTNLDSTPVLHILNYCNNTLEQYAELLAFSVATFTKTVMAPHGSTLEPCIQLLEPAHQALVPPKGQCCQALSIHPSMALAAAIDHTGSLLLWALMPVLQMAVPVVEDSPEAVAVILAALPGSTTSATTAAAIATSGSALLQSQLSSSNNIGSDSNSNSNDHGSNETSGNSSNVNGKQDLQLTLLAPCLACTWLDHHGHQDHQQGASADSSTTPIPTDLRAALHLLAVAHQDHISILALQLDVGKQVHGLKRVVRVSRVQLPDGCSYPQQLLQLHPPGLHRGTLSLLLLLTEPPHVEVQQQQLLHCLVPLGCSAAGTDADDGSEADTGSADGNASTIDGERDSASGGGRGGGSGGGGGGGGGCIPLQRTVFQPMDVPLPQHSSESAGIVTCMHSRHEAAAWRWVMTGTTAGRVQFWHWVQETGAASRQPLTVTTSIVAGWDGSRDTAAIGGPGGAAPAAGFAQLPSLGLHMVQECMCNPACGVAGMLPAGGSAGGLQDGGAEVVQGGGMVVHVSASDAWGYAAAITVCGQGDLEEGLYIWRHCPWVVEPGEGSGSGGSNLGSEADVEAARQQWAAARFLLEAAVCLADTGSCCTWLQHASLEPLLAVGYAAGMLHVFGRQRSHGWQVMAVYHSILPITCLAGLENGLLAAAAGEQLLVLHNAMSTPTGPSCLLPQAAHESGGALPLHHPTNLHHLLRKGLLDAPLHILRRLLQWGRGGPSWEGASQEGPSWDGASCGHSEEQSASGDGAAAGDLGRLGEGAATGDAAAGGELGRLEADVLGIVLECSWPDARLATLQELRQLVYEREQQEGEQQQEQQLWEQQWPIASSVPSQSAGNTYSVSTGLLDMSALGMGRLAPSASLPHAPQAIDTDFIATGLLDMSAFGVGASAPMASRTPVQPASNVDSVSTGLLDMSAFGMDSCTPAASSTSAQPPGNADSFSTGLLDMSCSGMLSSSQPSSHSSGQASHTSTSVSTGLLDITAFGMTQPAPPGATHQQDSLSTGLLDMSAFGMTLPAPCASPALPAPTHQQDSLSTGLLDMSAFGMTLRAPCASPALPAPPTQQDSLSTGLLDMSAFGMTSRAPHASSAPPAPPTQQVSLLTDLLDMPAFGTTPRAPRAPPAAPAATAQQDSLSTGVLDMSAFGMGALSQPSPEPAAHTTQTSCSTSTGRLDMSTFGMTPPPPPLQQGSISTGLLDMSAFGMASLTQSGAPPTSSVQQISSSISTRRLDVSTFGTASPTPPAPLPQQNSISTGMLNMSACGMTPQAPPALSSQHDSISNGAFTFRIKMPIASTQSPLLHTPPQSTLLTCSPVGMQPSSHHHTSLSHATSASTPSATATAEAYPSCTPGMLGSAAAHSKPAVYSMPGHIQFPRAFACEPSQPAQAPLLTSEELDQLEDRLRPAGRHVGLDGGQLDDRQDAKSDKIVQALSLTREAAGELLQLAAAMSIRHPCDTSGAMSAAAATKSFSEHVTVLDPMGRLALVAMRLATSAAATAAQEHDQTSHTSQRSALAESVLKLFRSMPAVSRMGVGAAQRSTGSQLNEGGASGTVDGVTSRVVEKGRGEARMVDGRREGFGASESDSVLMRRPRSAQLQRSHHSSTASLTSLLPGGNTPASTSDPSKRSWPEWVRLLPGLDTRPLLWALSSNTPAALLDACASFPIPSSLEPAANTSSMSFSFSAVSSTPGRSTPANSWPALRRLGAAFWLTDMALLKKTVEGIARMQYMERRDPHDCALLYLALQKKSVLVGLFKSAGNTKLAEFISRNFHHMSQQHSAAKNAFALLGQHRYELAAGFFILAQQWQDAVGVLLREAADPQLALLVARLLDNEPTGKLQHWVITQEMLPVALSCHDPWAVGLLATLAGDRVAAVLSMLPPSEEAGDAALRQADPSTLDYVLRWGIPHLSGRPVPSSLLLQLQHLVVSSSHQLEVWGLPLLALQTISLLPSCLYPRHMQLAARQWLEQLLAATLQHLVLHSEQDYPQLRPTIDSALHQLKMRLIVHAPSERVHQLLQQLLVARRPSQLPAAVSINALLPIVRAASPFLSPTTEPRDPTGCAFSPLPPPRLQLSHHSSWAEEHDMISPPSTNASTPCSGGPGPTSTTDSGRTPDGGSGGGAIEGSQEGLLAQAWNLAFFDGDKCRAAVCCHGEEFSMFREPFRPLAVATGKAGICQGELVAPEGQLQSEVEGPKSVLMGLMQQMLDHVRWTPDPWAMMSGDLATRRGGPGAAHTAHVFSDVLAQHPQRNLFLSGSTAGHLYLWQYGEDESRALYSPHLADMAPASSHAMPYHWGSPRAITFARMGHRFAAVGEGGLVALWQLDRLSGEDGVGYAEWSHQCVSRHASGIAFLGDTGSQVLVSGLGDRGGVVSLWDTMAHSGSACISMLQLHRPRIPAAISLACFGASPTLLCATDNCEVGAYDLRMLAEGRTLWNASKLHTGAILSLHCWNTSGRRSGRGCLHPDLPQHIVVTGGKDGAISLLDMDDGRVVQVVDKAHYFSRKRLQNLFDRMPRPSPRSPRRPGPHPATLSKPPNSATPAPVLSAVPCSQGVLSSGSDGTVRFHCFTTAPQPAM